MNVSIKKRIYWSFALLVLLFVANGIISIITLNKNLKLSRHISTVIDPTLLGVEDFQDMLTESKMYSTDWVFLRSNQADKNALQILHTSGYPKLKKRLNPLFLNANDKFIKDSLNKAFAGFEELIVAERKIMSSLQKFEDYDDPVAKFESERIIEDEVLPRTSALMNTLTGIVAYEKNNRLRENMELAKSFMRLATLISVLAITIICIGFFLSLYFTKIIISPINKIKNIINDLGKGVLQKLNYKESNDEIGEIIRSVNHLSEKLQDTATFATEIGNRNFQSYFEPVSSKDTLGKALVAMRDNIKLSDEKLNDAQHIAHIGSWERNIKTDEITISDEMFSIFDIDPLSFDFKFQSIMKFIHPDDIKYAMQINRENQYLPPVSYECRIITSKGIIKNIWVQTKVILGKYAEIEKTFGIVQDITERKRSEEKLAEERELFQLVIENIPDQIYLKDTESRFILCNKPVAINAGYLSQAEVIGKTDFDFLPLKIAKKCFIQEQSIMESGIPLINNEEHMLDKVTGQSRWALSTKFPLRNNTGAMIGLIGINHDITERKIAEKELENVNRELSLLFNSIDEIFFSVNMDTLKVIQISPSCEKLYGYKPSEFMENYMLWIDIIHPDDKHVIENEDVIMQRGDQVNNQYRIIRKDKNIRWVETKITPTLNVDGYLIRVDGVTRDITERKNAEKSLQKSQANLAINNRQLAQKNKELEQFAYVASHDLQEPLNTTISFVELFKQQYFGKLDSKADKYLTYIVKASDRMRVLIKDLLDISRIGQSKFVENTDCNLILNDVIEDISKMIKESGAEIKAGSLPVVSGYATDLRQLFQNLIINSIKFRKKNISPKINISASKKNDYWQFAFNDNGIGIDKEHNERIFIIFQRLYTRSEYEGSGIGLSHCKKIVELHHGKIWVESTPNEGSTFYFTIHSPKEKSNDPKIKLHHAD